MEAAGRILIVDDDTAFLKAYRVLLGEEGYDVETVTEQDTALARLGEGGWDVVLLDQKLRGPGGPDTGIDLVQEVLRRAPGARPIVVTGYASPDMVIRAFEAGAYDYLEKSGSLFDALLKAKIRNAVEVARERQLGALKPGQLEPELRALWDTLRQESDSNRKGRLLEEFMLMLFKTIPGFHHVDTRRRNEVEEIDLVIRNESSDPLWQKESPFVLVECKNWTKPVGVEELRLFLGKLERRYDRCRLGFFVALGGFAKTVHLDQLAERKSAFVVVPLNLQDVIRLVESDDRNGTLKALYQRAVLTGNGHQDG